MATNSPVADGLLEGLRQNAGWAVGVGIVLIVVGILAVASPMASGLAVTLVVGALLIVGGVAQCFLAFRAGAFGRALLIFLVGLVKLIAGIFLVTRPVAGLASLTLFLAAYFVAVGILAIVAALKLRGAPSWIWMLLNGIVTLLLGLMIWAQWPLSGAWAIGVLFGLQLLMNGIALASIGSAVRGAVKRAAAA
jgi:uncharacterized membrane protein HdeD (DUF308 family)